MMIILLERWVRNKCQQVIADPLEIDVGDVDYAFRYLKENVDVHA